MIGSLRRTFVVLVLVGAIGILAWLVTDRLSAEPVFQVPETPVVGAALASGDVELVSETIRAPAFPAIAEFSEIIKRPLFDETRRPFRRKVAAAPQASSANSPRPQKPKVNVPDLKATLTGVVRSPDGDVAILTIEGASEPVKLVPGGSYRGWSLTDVGPDAVAFSAEGKEVKLRLNFKNEPGLGQD